LGAPLASLLGQAFVLFESVELFAKAGIDPDFGAAIALTVVALSMYPELHREENRPAWL
jgi:hypothetical protein